MVDTISSAVGTNFSNLLRWAAHFFYFVKYYRHHLVKISVLLLLDFGGRIDYVEGIIMNILFILPVASHVRYHKRISALKENCNQIRIFAFERNGYPSKKFDTEYMSLGRVKNENYIKRLWPLLKAIENIRKHVKDIDVIYSFGLDTLFIAYILKRMTEKKIKIVYEVGDIREILIKNKLSCKLLRTLERFLLKEVRLLVVTSYAYVTGYYNQLLRIKNIACQTIENKIDTKKVRRYVDPKEGYDDKNKDVIRIGYFGCIRCQKSILVLKQIAGNSKNYKKVYVRGKFIGMPNVEREIEAIPNIEYGGAYIYPDDFAKIYQKIDIVWIALTHAKSNFLWSRVNRFYEACYFNRPMIAQKGTQDGKIVEKYQIGLNIDLNNMEKAMKDVLMITPNDISFWKDNLSKLPTKIYCYTDEHKKLIDCLNS